ncbi:MAG: hypothetical protein HFG20_08775 [Anaerotruncus sp.]|nr:hypothetical protein [Anaerotruncus sp.]
MILWTVRAVKIILLTISIGSSIFLFKDKLNKKQLIYIALSILPFTGIAQIAVRFIPSLTDEITLTAHGEKNEAADAAEIFLRSFTADGKEISVGHPVTGKWFWAGEQYAWRIETDHR